MNTEQLNTQTLAITDFEVKTPTIAKVVISFTGRQTKDSIRAALLKKFDYQAAPVEDSFRLIKAGVGVGFLRTNKEVRVISKNELRASYRVISSNIMMDNNDKTLWEVKDGKSGKFLARHGNEDLSELVSAAVYHRGDVPRLSNITIASAAAGEFASFVSKSGDLDYGFVVAANAEKVQVVSASSKMTIIVPQDMVTAMDRVPVPKSFNQSMVKAGISRADKDQAIEYWKKLYSYNPAYLDMVIEQVNEDTLA